MTAAMETGGRGFPDFTVTRSILKYRSLPSADADSSLVTPHWANRAPSCIQLLDTRSLKLITCELTQAPAYVAISHVWAEKLFPVSPKKFIGSVTGFRLVIAALSKRSPEIHHIWVDTWCIDQENTIDKHRQMRLMGEIYQTANFVLVTLNHNLNHTQSDLNDIMSRLSKAAEIYDKEVSWSPEALDFFASAEIVESVLSGHAFLESLMQSSWPRRLWCFQEAALAKEIIWIGLDRVPLHMKDIIFLVILVVPLIKPELRRRLGPDWRSSTALMQPLLCHRLGWTDQTSVMQAAYLRDCTFQEDEIYGLMGASGVTIEPDSTKSMEMLWKKWWEEAVGLGHIRWLMLTWDTGYPDLNRNMEDSIFGCVVPPPGKRIQASTDSQLHGCRPYGAVSVSEDCVKAEGYCVGTCSSFVYLGSATNVSDTQSCFKTVAGLGRGDLELTMRIVAAMWYANTPESQTRLISQQLCSMYHSSSADNWDMRQLYQSCQDGGYNSIFEPLQYLCAFLGKTCGMELYLTTIKNKLKSTEVIMQANGPIAPGNFLALDLNADLPTKDMEDLGLRVFMIAQTIPEVTIDRIIPSYKPSPYLHKAGITTPVRFVRTLHQATALQDHTWDGSPLENFTFSLTAESCSGCRLHDSTAPEIRRWLRDLYKKGVEQISPKDIQVEYQRRFGNGQVTFLQDVKNRAMIDKALHWSGEGGRSIEAETPTQHDQGPSNTTADGGALTQ